MGVPLHVVGADACVTKRGGRLVVVRDQRVVHSMPLLRLSELVLHGAVGLTTHAMHALLDAGVPVVLLRRDGRARGRLEPPGSPHAQLRQIQLVDSLDARRRVMLARSIVGGKIHNQRALLHRRSRGRSGDPNVVAAVRRLREMESRCPAAETVEELLGLEGAAGAAYFGLLRRLLPDDLGFRRRDRRGHDIFNALVNYCSALLRESVIGAIAETGLDPHLSHLHVPMRGRPTLAFDLMEEWRPAMVESNVLALLGLRTVRPEHLVSTAKGPRLTDDARAAAINRFQDRLGSVASTWPPRGYSTTYGEQLRTQAASYSAWVQRRAEVYQPFQWR
ncbi:MAG: CRISPR-associated endonuclease Cas1 [Acidimicrobiales bacterium]